MKDKDTIRRHMLDFRRQLLPSVKIQADNDITRTVLAREEIQHAQVLCIYKSFPEEVDTQNIIKTLAKLKKKIVIPPRAVNTLIDISDVAVFIVPGLAFDTSGYRIGWGVGYYDKLLAHVSAFKIGLAYECQIVSRLPHEVYDIPMDVVITENSE